MRTLLGQRRVLGTAVVVAVLVVAVLAVTGGSPRTPRASAAPARGPASASARSASVALTGIHKIRHVIIIMQENRSFDQYFGTYPGADGIPGLAGHPGKVPCVPDPAAHTCV